MTRMFSLAALAVVGALVLAACGSSGSSGSGTSTSSGASSTPSHGSAKPSTSNTSNSSGATAAVSTKTSSLGTFLVDAKGRTLYLWDADHGSMSTCTGACAQAWPPVTTTATPKASGAVKASLLGTTKRTDGSREATYAGHPLYTFAGDTQPGQTTGEGSNAFGAPWWVVSPAGKALQH
jgi:predicted lipoprotein with Yx(FWY)xxD motif